MILGKWNDFIWLKQNTKIFVAAKKSAAKTITKKNERKNSID